jgi:hypothetical protein
MCLVGVSLNSIPYVILYLSRSISPSPTQRGPPDGADQKITSERSIRSGIFR